MAPKAPQVQFERYDPQLSFIIKCTFLINVLLKRYTKMKLKGEQDTAELGANTR